MFDLIIKNGRIVDGGGGVPFLGDIAVMEDKIALVAPKITEPAASVIDACGMAVTPGFIDCHSHADMDMLFGASGYNLTEQGITTAICGQCGILYAPSFENQFKNEGRTPVLGGDLSEICMDYDSFVGYVDKLSLPFNVAFYAGQGNIRGAVCGFENRKSTPAELERMRDYVKSAMGHGFLGISSGLIYPPSWCADADELVSLSSVCADYGGNYITHIRSEKDGVLEAVAEAIDIGRRAGCGVIISHHKVGGKNNVGKSAQTLRMIDDANAEGIFVCADQYPYLAGSTGLIATIPNELTTDGLPALIERLRDGDFRRRVTQLLQLPQTESTFKSSGFDGCLVLTADKTPDAVGKNIAQIAAARGISPYDVVYDLLVENDGQVGMAFFFINEPDMLNILAHERVMCGTDSGLFMSRHSESETSGGHPRSTGTFPRHLQLVRERGILPIEKAIARITSQAARSHNLPGIGMIRQGFAADICIIDWENVRGNADFSHPFLKNSGIEYVIVNGSIAACKGSATGACGGRRIQREAPLNGGNTNEN